MILHTTHGDGNRLVPPGIGFVIIVGRKLSQPSLRAGIPEHFLRQPHISLGSYAIEAAVRETDAARKEREARGVAAQPRTGLDRGGPPPRMLPHST
jgi:hypothetical protein